MTNQTQTPRDAAIEKALKEIHAHEWERVKGGPSWDWVHPTPAHAAITAYEQARADERRALVATLNLFAVAFGASETGSDDEANFLKKKQDAERALLEALGIQEEER